VQVVYYVASSLDGYIAAAGGGVDWLKPFEGSGEDYGYAAFYAGVDALLMGRRTFEHALALGAWPYAGKPCRVFTRKAPAGAPAGVAFTADEPRAVVAELAADGHRRVWLAGGGELAGAFQRAGLISEIVLSVMPVLLGAGVPLFAGGAQGRLAVQLRCAAA
jgi:dihydrofolate reductase